MMLDAEFCVCSSTKGHVEELPFCAKCGKRIVPDPKQDTWQKLVNDLWDFSYSIRFAAQALPAGTSSPVSLERRIIDLTRRQKDLDEQPDSWKKLANDEWIFIAGCVQIGRLDASHRNIYAKRLDTLNALCRD